jgi:hypothetical protein
LSGTDEPPQDDLPSNVKGMLERILEKVNDQERRDARLPAVLEAIRRGLIDIDVDHTRLTQTDKTGLLLHLASRHGHIGPADSPLVDLQELHATFHPEVPSPG